VKKSVFHIISALFLISSLLFTQLAVNFFHRNHNVHQVKAKDSVKNDRAELNLHGDHCKVCTIDFFNHAFVNSELRESSFVFSVNPIASVSSRFEEALSFSSQGRAPPALF
jgi:hypothetical protein